MSLATTPIHQVDDGGVICSARRTERHQKAPDDVNNVHARRARQAALRNYEGTPHGEPILSKANTINIHPSVYFPRPAPGKKTKRTPITPPANSRLGSSNFPRVAPDPRALKVRADNRRFNPRAASLAPLSDISARFFPSVVFFFFPPIGLSAPQYPTVIPPPRWKEASGDCGRLTWRKHTVASTHRRKPTPPRKLFAHRIGPLMSINRDIFFFFVFFVAQSIFLNRLTLL